MYRTSYRSFGDSANFGLMCRTSYRSFANSGIFGLMFAGKQPPPLNFICKLYEKALTPEWHRAYNGVMPLNRKYYE